MLFVGGKDERFPYVYFLVQAICCYDFRGMCSQKGTAGIYLPGSDSRGSSVNASALKSKGSASCRSSIRSLSVLLLALIYLDAAAKEEEKNMFTFLLSL